MKPEKLVEYFFANPAATILVAFVLLMLFIVGWALRLPAVRHDLTRYFWIVRSSVSIETSWADLRHWSLEAVNATIVVTLVSFLNKKEFSWSLFFSVLVSIALARFGLESLRAIERSELLSRPMLGRVWRDKRKTMIAGILNRVNSLTEQARPVNLDTLRVLLTDLLTVTALHVRDYRGNHKTVNVFCSLLLIDGEELLVAARDENLSGHKDLKRDIGLRYKTSTMAAAKSIATKRAYAVGDYHVEYPDYPKNRPYRSILSIPLFSTSDSRVIGVVSIDSSHRYFFHSFTEGQLVSNLENSVAPFLASIVLVLECLVSRDPEKVVAFLSDPRKGG